MSGHTATAEPYAPSRRSSRFALTGLALVYLVLGIPTLVVLIVVTVAIPLGVLGIGLAALAAFVPFLRQLANVHRYFATQVLRTTVPSPYHERESSGVNVVVKDWARDPARWRDLGWSYVSVTVGWFLSWIPVGLLLGVVWFLIFPFIYWVTPKGVFDMSWRIVQVHDVASSFSMWVAAGLCALVWWVIDAAGQSAACPLDLALLAPTRGELERRLVEVSASRAETIDHSAAELRRIERDLHDGAQARLVSLGMSLGLAERAHAHRSRGGRTADRGGTRRPRPQRSGTCVPSSVGSTRRCSPTAVWSVPRRRSRSTSRCRPPSAPSLPGRAPEPVESAMYFAVAEALANVVKHARATAASVELSLRR